MWRVLQSLPPAGTNCGRFFFTISDINTEVSEVILASFWSPEACDCTCCYHDTCLFPEHSDSCWKCCLIFLIERHEHFYSIVALTKAHTFFIIIIIMLTYTHCLRMMEEYLTLLLCYSHLQSYSHREDFLIPYFFSFLSILISYFYHIGLIHTDFAHTGYNNFPQN